MNRTTKTILISWELKKIYTFDNMKEIITDFCKTYEKYLDYPTLMDFVQDNNLDRSEYESEEEAYYEYLINEFDLFIHNNEDLYTIKTIKV